tara:strand:+ start:684 stop:935 length:252 start_codon:yes stop_codon:yes gene_type:complete
MKKEKLEDLITEAYMEGVQDKSFSLRMVGFTHDFEDMAENYAATKVRDYEDISNSFDHDFIERIRNSVSDAEVRRMIKTLISK